MHTQKMGYAPKHGKEECKEKDLVEMILQGSILRLPERKPFIMKTENNEKTKNY